MKGTIKVATALMMATALASAGSLAQTHDARSRGMVTVKNYETGKTDGVRILVKMKSQYGDWAAVDPAQSFRKGDQVRISFEPNFDGYLYVVNVMPSGKKRLLFPAQNDTVKETNNLIHAHQVCDVPAKAVFEFDEEAGTETLQVILSHDPMPVYDSAVKNPNGDLDDSASSAAAELATNEKGRSARKDRGGIDVAMDLPQEGSGTSRSRGVDLAAGKNKDEKSSVVAIPDDKGQGGKLKAGDWAQFQIRLKHI